MPTLVTIPGTAAPSGGLLRARVYNPDGTINGDVALIESPVGSWQYGGSASLTMPDTTNVPYTYEVREVETQDDVGFNDSILVWRGLGKLGFVVGGVLYETLAVIASGTYPAPLIEETQFTDTVVTNE